jgi:2-keto-3-deoxy-L-fuconate dehydrogenase
MLSLKGKTAVITGGASGIGKAIALLFGRQGAAVHIIELNMNAAKETVEEIGAEGGTAFAHGCDISQQDAVKASVAGIGHIDILVNNAGIAHIGNATNTSVEDFEKVFAVNVKGLYNCLHTVIPVMKRKGAGVILNMGSIASSVGLTDRFAYSMSKAAVHGITLSVARDYLADHIRCNSISPARVHTPFVDGFINKNYPGKEKEMFEKLSASQPIGRMAQPSEIAMLALYLCSDESSFITGTDYPIDGGFITLST